MKTRNTIIIMVLLCSLISSCTKNDVMNFTGPDSVYFYERFMYLGYDERRTETIVYSFAVKPSDLEKDTIKVKVRLQGRVSETDRYVNAGIIADSTTAIEGTHFTIGQGVITAGQYDGYIPVIVKKTSDMNNKVFRIKLRIETNEWFQIGVIEDNFIAIELTNKIMKPTNWPQWYGFGMYSDNKYRFVIDILGITDFPVANRYQTEPIEGIYTAAQLFAFAYQLQLAYTEHKKLHGPIYMDDNADPKVEISFN